MDKTYIQRNIDLIDAHKVFISKAYGMGNAIPAKVINNPIIGEPNTCCTETYLMIGPFSSENESINVVSYVNTKFFRFLVLLIKNTQNAMKKVYSFVPMQNFNENWTDEKLYKKYNLTAEEIAFIESMIRPMGLADA